MLLLYTRFMKFVLGMLCGGLLVSAVWWHGMQSITPTASTTVPSEVIDVFRFTIEDEVNHAITTSDEGYTPEQILRSFPGIVASDFADVPANNGRYFVQEGDVMTKLDESGLVPNHKTVLNREGYTALLENILERLDMDVVHHHSIADLLIVIRAPRS